MCPKVKTLVRFSGVVLGLVLAARANLLIPGVEMKGESVSVLLRRDYADVHAVFEYGPAEGKDADRAFLPVFASPEATKEQILEDIKLQVVEEEFHLLDVSVVEAPKGKPAKYGKLSIVWLELRFTRQPNAASGDSVRLQLSYTQKTLGGRFLYLPIIVGQRKEQAEGGRDWRFQMNVHALGAVQVLSKETDFSGLGRDVVVYLRDGQVVSCRDLYGSPVKSD